MSENISFVKLKPEDLLDMKHLFSKAGPFIAEHSLSDYWLYTRLFGDTCIGVKDKGKLIAVLIAFFDQSKNRNEIYLQDLVVLKEYRAMGIGSELIKRLTIIAQKAKVTSIWLTSEIENKHAISLWKKMGFKNLKTDHKKDGFWISKNLKGPNRDRLVFTLKLDYK